MAAPSAPGPGRVFWRVTRSLRRSSFLETLASIEESVGEIDLIHAHFYPDGDLGRAAKRARGIPLVVTEHSSAFAGAISGKALSRSALRRALRVYEDSSAITAVSEFLRDRMVELGISQKIHVVPNPLPGSTFRRRGVSPALDEVVYVGRLESVKRVDLLLRALARIPTGQVRLLHIVGDGTLRNSLFDLSHSLGLEERVIWHGWLPRADVARTVEGVALSVTASAVETFGVNVAESLCLGVPVVAFAAGAIPEIVDETCGVLVRDHNPEALARGVAVGLALARAADRSAIASTARRRFSDAEVRSKMEPIYARASLHL